MHPKVFPVRTVRLLIPSIGFALLAIATSISCASANPVSEADTAYRLKQTSETAVVDSQDLPGLPLSSPTQYRYSPAAPLTANTYPSITLCARAFAFRLANDIRKSNQFSPGTKFAIAIDTKTLGKDKTRWPDSEKFIADFQNELEGQFPAGTFVIATNNVEKTEARTIDTKLKTLDIDFSHSDPTETTDAVESSSKIEADPSGSIQASWTIGDTAPAKTTINYVTKWWIAIDFNWSCNHPKSFGLYQSGSYKSKVTGFTDRLARSPREAARLAKQNAVHFHMLQYGSGFSPADFEFKVIDRFPQKLSMPNGEFWQAAVFVAVTQKNEASNPSLPPSPVNSAGALLMLIAGTLGVIWTFNFLAQGYFLPIINYALVAALAAILGLAVYALFTAA